MMEQGFSKLLVVLEAKDKAKEKAKDVSVYSVRNSGSKRKEVTPPQSDDYHSDASHSSKKHKTKGCTFGAFQVCKPKEFRGTEGAVAAARWLEKTESVMRLCKCASEDKVLFAAGLFEDGALE